MSDMKKVEQWIKENKVRIVKSDGSLVASGEEQMKLSGIIAEPIELRRELLCGNSYEVLKQFPDNTFSAVVTDPPYGLSSQPDMREVLRHWLDGDDYEHSGGGFMNKSWDSFVPGPKIWAEIMRVLKPGGHIFSFSGTRTYDLMVTAMRLAGSEIRDKIDYYCGPENYLAWCHGQGFPKSLNISKAMDREAGVDREMVERVRVDGKATGQKATGFVGGSSSVSMTQSDKGVTENAKLWEGYGSGLKPAHEPIAVFGKGDSQFSGSEVPFKYTSKASGKERNYGCENLFWQTDSDGKTYAIPKEDYDRMVVENDSRKDDSGFEKHKISQGNTHPTVKPLELMRYLVKMVKMPGENLILDPFMGSGTTMVACELEGCGYVGIDMEENSVKIAQARIDYARKNGVKGYK